TQEAELIDINQLLNITLSLVEKDKAGIILRKGTSNYYESEKLIGFKVKNLFLKSDNFLIRHLKKIKSIEIKEELTLKIKNSSSKEETAQLIQLKEKMSKVEAEVCFP
ncbi:unnamed protein product, partial [marine sediment metagenome]